jgi:hypothetical protein
MATPAFAVKIKEKNVPFLTQAGAFNTLDNVRGYIASIEGWLWGHANANLRGRLDAIKNDNGFKHIMNPGGHGAAPGGLLPFMRRLDHIAYDIKDAAGNEYECTPITLNVAKNLDTSNGATRDALGGLIDRFMEKSENDGAAPTHTIVHLQPPDATYRIDRESLSAIPAPRYWTYRIQVGGSTHGGIEMQSKVVFTLASVQAALRSSLASSAPNAAGFYVRLSAPQWLTDILNA